jgi:hypothetical protein
MQWKVFRETAEERLGEVGVRVDEAWDEDATFEGYGLRVWGEKGWWERGCLSYSHDARSSHQNAAIEDHFSGGVDGDYCCVCVEC